MSSIVSELREHTRTQHEAIEKRVDIIRPDLTFEQYRSLLARFYGFYVPVEMRLERLNTVSSLLTDFPRRRKTDKLLQDLSVLGMTPSQVADLPLCHELPPLDSRTHAMGCLYVLEGATLGGQIISRHVIQSLGVTPEKGCAFFSSYGEQVGLMWRTFTIQMTVYDLDQEARGQIITAAQQTFRSLELWLTERESRNHSLVL